MQNTEDVFCSSGAWSDILPTNLSSFLIASVLLLHVKSQDMYSVTLVFFFFFLLSLKKRTAYICSKEQNVSCYNFLPKCGIRKHRETLKHKFTFVLSLASVQQSEEDSSWEHWIKTSYEECEVKTRFLWMRETTRNFTTLKLTPRVCLFVCFPLVYPPATPFIPLKFSLCRKHTGAYWALLYTGFLLCVKIQQSGDFLLDTTTSTCASHYCSL